MTAFEEYVPDMIHYMNWEIHFYSGDWTVENKNDIIQKYDKEGVDVLFSKGLDTDDDFGVTIHNGIIIAVV